MREIITKRRLSNGRLYSLMAVLVMGLGWFATPVRAADLLTVEMETQQVDLDAAAVLIPAPEDVLGAPGADFTLSYNADRSPHAVVVPAGEGVEIAFVANVGFDGVTSEDAANLTFSAEPVDLAFTAADCVVIRTDQGAVFKIGNASESGLSVTFNYAAL